MAGWIPAAALALVAMAHAAAPASATSDRARFVWDTPDTIGASSASSAFVIERGLVPHLVHVRLTPPADVRGGERAAPPGSRSAGSLVHLERRGGRWAADVIAGTGIDGASVALALDRDDRPHVAYVHLGRVVVARREAGEWRGDVVADDVRDPIVALAPDGDRMLVAFVSRGVPHLAWLDPSGVETRRLELAGVEALALAGGAQGAHATFLSGTTVHHVEGRDGPIETIVELHVPGGSLDLALEPDGTPHVALVDATGDLFHGDQRSRWQLERVAGGAGSGIAIAVSRLGEPVITFARALGGPPRLIVAMRRGALWSLIEPSDLPRAAPCGLALDTYGTPHVLAVAPDLAGGLAYASAAIRHADVVATSPRGGGEEAVIVVHAGPSVTDVVASLRRGGATRYASRLTLTDAGGDGTFTASVDRDLVSMRGLEYHLSYLNERTGERGRFGDEKAPRRSALPARAHVSTSASFRLLSVPFAVESRENAPALLDRALGGPGSWRLLKWDPSIDAPVEIGAERPAALEPGRAYWFAAGGEGPLELEGRTFFPAGDEDRYLLELAPGWNAIGNPSGFDITLDPEALTIETPVLEKSFARAATDGQVHGKIFVFDAANSDSAGYRLDPPVLAPWEGAWVRNESSATLILRLPARELTPVERLAREREAAPTPLSWRLGLMARSDGEALGVALALASNGARGLDMLDVRMPPSAPDATLRIGVVHPGDATTGGAVPLYRDVRPIDSGDTEWVVEVSGERAPVELSWDAPVRNPRERFAPLGRLTLVDPDATQWDMHLTRSIVLPPGRHEVRIVAGSEATAAPSSMPFDAFIRPNPFRTETTFHYELPHAGAVSLGVFDVSGRRVWSHEEEWLPAGAHALAWDGRDWRAQRVRSGTYFLRVERAGEGRVAESLTRKITILP